jgi:hypothetical protein
VTQTTEAVTTDDLVRLRTMLEASSTVMLQPITLDVVDACTAIQRELLADPWDRLIVATGRRSTSPSSLGTAPSRRRTWSPPFGSGAEDQRPARPAKNPR